MEAIRPIFSQEAEKAVLGSVLINPEIFKSIDLKDMDFYIDKHQEIWRAYQNIAVSGGMIDIVSVGNKVKNYDLIDLISNVPSSLHAKEYSEIIKEKSHRRNLVILAGEMASAAYDQNSELGEEIPRWLTKLLSSTETTGGAIHVSKVLSELYDMVKERYDDPKEIWGIPTGLYDYDILTGGNQQGEVTLLSGKPGLGKSILAIQMAFGMSNDSPGAIYEMEMGRVQTVRREISTQSRIPNRNLKTGKMSDNDWQQFMDSISLLEKKPVYISDYTGWTTASLRADLARLKAQHDIKWFVLDYVQLLADRYGKDDSEKAAYTSKQIKNICKDLNLAGIVINSMTKSEMESDKPSMAAQKGSAQLIYDADVVFFLVEDGNNLKLHFSKFREDVPNRYIKLVRDDGFPAFKCASNDIKFTLPYKD
jgi:replicative DNA helicase